MAKLANLARMTTATTGTGTITLGSAAPGFLTFAQAGVTNGEVVSYGIADGTNSEVGTGTYTSAGTTLTRTVLASTNGGSAISLSGTAHVFITALAQDIDAKAPLASPALTGTPTAPTAGGGTNSTQVATTAFVQGELTAKAPLASPVFTGDPQAPTPATADNDTSVATTAFVKAQGYITSSALSPYAPLASPALSGNPTAPTPAGGDNDTSIATTAFVQGELAAKAPLASPALTGNPTAPTPGVNDNDTSIATTAFVLGQLSSSTPAALSAGSAGSATTFARGDHAHPSAFRDYAFNTGTNDLNSYIVQGVYELNSFTNGPSDIGDSWCLVEVHRHSNTGVQYLVQHLTTMTTTPVKYYIRDCVNGTWGAWVRFDNFARLASPAFTGDPTAPTPAAGDNDTSIATTAFVRTAGREKLTANRTYYVRTDGSDSNTGLADNSGGAFLTIQKAMDTAATLDCSTFNLTIQVRSGTYSAGVTLKRLLGTGTFALVGDTTTPSNVVISSGGCIVASHAGIWSIGGFKLTSTSYYAIEVTGISAVTINGSMDFGAVTGGYFHMIANDGGAIYNTATAHSITGGAGHFLYTGNGGRFSNQVGGVTITISASLSITTFTEASGPAHQYWYGIAFAGSSFTGKRFNVANGGVIDTAGAGANYFPGSTTGTGTNFSASPWGLYL